MQLKSKDARRTLAWAVIAAALFCAIALAVLDFPARWTAAYLVAAVSLLLIGGAVAVTAARPQPATTIKTEEAPSPASTKAAADAPARLQQARARAQERRAKAKGAAKTRIRRV